MYFNSYQNDKRRSNFSKGTPKQRRKENLTIFLLFISILDANSCE